MPALRVLARNVGEHVAAPDTLLVRRRALEHVHRRDVAVEHLNRHADAVIAAFLPLAHLRIRFRVEEARVRVERLEHAGDRAVDQPVGFDRPDVIRVNRVQRGGKDLVLVRDLVFNRQGAAAVKAANQGAKDDGKDRNGDGAVATHIKRILIPVLDPVQIGFL